MRTLYHFENFGRTVSQLQSTIDDLKRNVFQLEADIAAVEKFENQTNPTKSAYPIAARNMKARRDNLVRTILVLQGKLNEAEMTQFTEFGSRLRAPNSRTPI
jgi:hypothetical protein